MCGIVGVISKKQTKSIDSIVSDMANSIESRGPNGEGFYIYDNIAFGHRRLSIIDLKGGKQPMSDDTNQYSVTYNGELYNYKLLRIELEKKGFNFRTDSDTEVILNSYICWGEGCLNRFRGMFAFAILDKLKDTVFLARDPFGIKPLCFYNDESFFAFSSEISAFKKIPGFDKTISLQALDMYLWLQYIPAPESIFKSVKKLMPGHCMLLDKDGNTLYNKAYNNFSFKPDFKRKESDWLEELDHKLEKSVKLHLMSDVPYGAFLSGGIDSTAIVSIMAKELKKPIKTFSIGFNESSFSELPYARKVAEKWGTDHYEEIVEPEALKILPDLVRHYGEPFGDSSALPTYYLSKLAAEHVPMVLSGDGGDEIFAGYGSHINWMKEISKPDWVENLPSIRQKIYPILNKLSPNKYPKTWKKPRFDVWIKYVEYLNTNWRTKLWKNEYKQFIQVKNTSVENSFSEGLKFQGVNTVQYFDIQNYLPNDILTKVDIASMMHGLEVRTPLIDMELWDFALTIPEKFNIQKVNNNHWEGKLLLKKWLEIGHFNTIYYSS